MRHRVVTKPKCTSGRLAVVVSRPALIVSVLLVFSTAHAEDRILTVVAGNPSRPVIDARIGGADYRLQLEPHTVLADGFRLLDCGPGGTCHDLAVPLVVSTYRARIRQRESGQDAGIAAVARKGDGWHAVVRLDDESWWQVEPVKRKNAAASSVPEYTATPMLFDGGISSSCGCTEHAVPVPIAADPRHYAYGSGDIETVIEVAVDTDFEYIQGLAFSQSAAIADVESVFNAVSLIYEQEFGVTYELTTLILRPESPFPYTSSNHQVLLGQMQTEWNSNLSGIHRDVAHLLTGKEIDSNIIGFAFTDTMCEVCGNAEGYGFSETRFSTLLSRRACLTAHELGHNWGASHCDGSQDCGIMCSIIGGCSGSCTSFGQFTGAVIAQSVAGATCSSTYVEPINFPFCETFSATIDPMAWNVRLGVTTTQAVPNPPSGTYVLQLDNCCTACSNAPDEIRSNRIRMAGIPDATITYYAREGGTPAMVGSSLVLEVGDGVGWTEVDRLTAIGETPDGFERYAVDIPAEELTDDFRFRFRIEPVSGSDVWYVDSVLVSGQEQASNRLYVSATGVPWNDGGSWNSPLSSPADAISLGACALVDEVWVSEGTYTPDRGTANRNLAFELGDNVSVLGGFSGNETEAGQRDPDLFPTTLSGEIGDAGTAQDNSYHVVRVTGTAGSALLSGFTIRDGYADLSPTDGGGGLIAVPGSAVIENCRFENNTGYAGGAMRLALGSLFDISDTYFIGNEALDKGGGVNASLGSQPSLRRCVFYGNHANSWGGGAYFSDSLVDMEGSLVYANSSQSGAGLYNHFATLTLENSTIVRNSATSAVGGLFNNNGAVTLDNDILWENVDSIFSGQSSQISGGTPVINYSCVEGWNGSLGGVGNTGQDPLFADADGPDMTPGTEDDNYRLSFLSPLRNTGSPTADPFGFDLQIHPRVICGMADMGAYEFGLGDSDCDGEALTLADFSPWPQCRTEPGVAAAVNCRVLDLNVDGSLDLRDYAIWQRLLAE